MRLGALLFLFALFVALAPRASWPPEPRAQAAAARSLVAHGTFDVGGELTGEAARATIVHDGRQRPLEPPGPAIALAPVEALASLASGLRAPRVRLLLEAAAAALAAALTCMLFLSTLRRAGVRPEPALAATAVLGLATNLCAAARVPDGTALATLGLSWAVVRARSTGTAGALGIGAVAGGLVLIDPALLPAGVVLIALTAFARPADGRRDPVAIAAMALPIAVAAALVLMYRAQAGFFPDPPGDLAEGLDGLLLSTGKSLFLYSPILLVLPPAIIWWWRTSRREAGITLAVCATVIVAVALSHRWHGDPAWGPRRVTPIVPLLLEPIARWLDVKVPRRRARLGLVAVLALAGLMVQLLGVLVSPTSYARVLATVHNATGASGWFPAPDGQADARFIPQFSPLVGHYWVLRHLRGGDAAADAPWRVLQANTPKLDAELRAVPIDLWWVGWPRLDGALLLVALALLALAGAWATWRRLRMLR